MLTETSVTNMTTKIIKIGNKLSSSAIKAAAESLSLGHVIAVPTDTIYGISCLVQHSTAVEKLYAIKGRNSSKPIAICVSEIEEIYTWASVTVSRNVLEELLPGQVTVVFNRTEELNNNFNPDTNLIGIRIPDHDFLRQVCRLCSSPLALTSANLSNNTSTLNVMEFADLHDSLNLVFDGGKLSDSEEARLGSTVVDLSQEGSYSIIRGGSAKSKVENILSKYGLIER